MASPFTADQPFKENNVINESEQSVDPTDDAGKLVQLEADGKFSEAFLKPKAKVRAYIAAATSTLNAAVTKINFDTEDFDIGSHFAGGTFTAPRAGFYQVSVVLNAYTASSADQYIGVYLYKNGSSIARGVAFVTDSGGVNVLQRTSPTISQLIYLVQNDTLETYSDSTTTGTIEGEITRSAFTISEQ